MTVITALVVVYAMDEFGDLDAGLGFLVACFLAAGAIQVLMGVFRLGAFIRYIPYPVLSGFMSGIGVIIIILQIFSCIWGGEFTQYCHCHKKPIGLLFREQNQPS